MAATVSGAVVRGISGTIGVMVTADLLSRTGLVGLGILPRPSAVLAEAVSLVTDRGFLVDVAASVGAWAAGLAAAVIVAAPLGVLLGCVPIVEVATRALVELLRPIPSVALIPLGIIVFGADAHMKIALTFYAACWPILINTMYAIRDADPAAKETLRSFGFGPLGLLWWVGLPSAAPLVLTGIRVAASIGIIVTISVELLSGGTHGIGVFLIESQSGGGHPASLLAGALWAGLLGLAVNTVLVGVGRRLFRWHYAREASG
jgi:NitT/TauT family transport system permease protein